MSANEKRSGGRERRGLGVFGLSGFERPAGRPEGPIVVESGRLPEAAKALSFPELLQWSLLRRSVFGNIFLCLSAD